MIFSLVSWGAVYFVVWWITLFAVLPFGVRNQVHANEITVGTEPGAPVKAPILRVIVMTTLASTVIFLGIYWFLTVQPFGLDDIPFLPKFDLPR